MRFLAAAILFFSFLAFAFVSAEAVESNSCAVEGNVLSVEKLSENALSVTFETTLARNDSTGLPCFFHANEEVTALVQRPQIWGGWGRSYYGVLIDLRAGDAFTAALNKWGYEWNETNFLRNVVIKNPSCAPLEGCGIDCGNQPGLGQNGLGKNARGCYECTCRGVDTGANEPPLKFFRFSFAAGWNYYSYPLAQQRDAYCLPSPDKPCLQKTGFLPRIIATDCDSQATLWRWADGGRTYSEFQFPDVGKKESTSFAGELLAGYWFKAAAPCSITIAGEELVASEKLEGKQLFKGWNSLGTPLLPIVFDALKGDCVLEKGPYGWNAATQKFEKKSTIDLLEPGAAYFVKVARDCWLSVQR